MENWYFPAAVFLSGLAAGFGIFHFTRMPGKKQEAKIKIWMLFAVTEAERQLGGGKGHVKLRRVSDGFVKRFPKAAKTVTFEMFLRWVDEALVEMKKMLEPEIWLEKDGETPDMLMGKNAPEGNNL